MTRAIWKYSHLTLAIFSFLFLLLATLTGIILSVEPLAKRLETSSSASNSHLTLAETIPALRKKYPGITELSIEQNRLVLIKGTDKNGNKIIAYVNPFDGKIIGKPHKQSVFFQWVTSLHRSLFLHETGRALVGITAFLLLLIAISGLALVIKRQLGIKHFFAKITRDSFAQYYHVYMGRWALIPILLMAASGAYLSVVRFELLKKNQQTLQVDFDTIKDKPKKAEKEFDYFKNTSLSAINSIEFPFSTDVEDYYVVHAKTGDLALNQITGEILAETKIGKAAWWENLSLSVHTGRDSLLWALVLLLACAGILFFMYSGFAITFKRMGSKTKNRFKAADSHIVILVGSESGSTFLFAQAVYKQLIACGQKIFVAPLNSYQLYPQAKHMLVFTATYGLGEAPSNAQKFASLLKKQPQTQEISYAVLGFGSYAYADFCKFGVEVAHLLAEQSWAKPLLAMHTVADKSIDDFNVWLHQWAQHAAIPLTALDKKLLKKEEKLSVFTVQALTETVDETFMLTLTPSKKTAFFSGDLLAIYPANDHRERLYSIGKINQSIQLCVKLHPNGLGSSFLRNLQIGQTFNAKVVANPHFRFPADAKKVVLIANGTGIAPFLGMLAANLPSVETHLYAGFRYQSSYQPYQPIIEGYLQNHQLTQAHISLSRGQNQQYVFDLINRDAALLAAVLANGGKILLCGSLAMQKDVFAALELACQQYNGKGLDFYQTQKQILADCY